MKKKSQEKVYAFIDSQNLNLGIKSQGWVLDFQRFRRLLQDKYNVERAFLFIGYVPGNESLYTYLQESGFTCICLLYTSPSPRDLSTSRMPSSA